MGPVEGEEFQGALFTTTSLLYLTDSKGDQARMVLRVNERLTVVELSDAQLANIVADGACVMARRSRRVEEELRK